MMNTLHVADKFGNTIMYLQNSMVFTAELFLGLLSLDCWYYHIFTDSIVPFYFFLC